MIEFPKVFVAKGGAYGEDEDSALENGLSVIGFKEVGSLENAVSYEEVLKIVESAYPDGKHKTCVHYATQLWTFIHGMEEGDSVVLPRKLTSQIAIGTVAGSYKYKKVKGDFRHTRVINWKKTDIPRTWFEQDLLYSFGAFMTVCNVSRNDVERRVASVLAGKKDPGYAVQVMKSDKSAGKSVVLSSDAESGVTYDLARLAQDQVIRHIDCHFKGHAFARLVDAILKADGWVTKLSPAGADGGADIQAGRGHLGLDEPRLLVQVKSQKTPIDLPTFREFQGSIKQFGADKGLFVAWGGYNKIVLSDAKQGYFLTRLWDGTDVVSAIYRCYDKLPAEIQAELPMKQVWMLVVEEPEE